MIFMFIGKTMVIIQLQMKEVKEIACHLSDISFDDIAFKKVGNNIIMNKAINGVLSFNESNDVNGITFKNWFAKDASGADNHLVEIITDKDGREIKSDNILHKNNDWSGYIKASSIASEKNMVNITSVANDINKIIFSFRVRFR